MCDFTGQLAGAGATKILAAFGAEVIRIENPSNRGKWDILRGVPPFVGSNRGLEAGGAFNNHNAGKLGVTLNLREPRAREILEDLVSISDAVTENFAAGVLDRLGFGYESLKSLRENIVYVSNSGFGATGPYKSFKSWGPIAQAVSGLTFSSGLPDRAPAGWGYSFMDHTGAYYMAIATLMALLHLRKTGEGQWVDIACIESAGTLHGAASLDAIVNDRPMRRKGMPNSNRSQSPAMAPHGIWRAKGNNEWVSIAIRDDNDWEMFAEVINQLWANDERWRRLVGRLAGESELERLIASWVQEFTKFEVSEMLRSAGIPCGAVLKPIERIEDDRRTEKLWVEVEHSEVGVSRVEGLPLELSETNWHLSRGAPCLGEHNSYVLGELLGISKSELEDLAELGVI
ncbi:MAG: CoA transferase [Actinobacteria bacterium]|nr:CoA transferase [Actinomycetota bacterium]